MKALHLFYNRARIFRRRCTASGADRGASETSKSGIGEVPFERRHVNPSVGVLEERPA